MNSQYFMWNNDTNSSLQLIYKSYCITIIFGAPPTDILGLLDLVACQDLPEGYNLCFCLQPLLVIWDLEHISTTQMLVSYV
jgi:hypothetical protein